MKQLTKEQMILRLNSEGNLINILHRRDWSHQANGNGNNGRAGIFTKDEKETICVLAEEIGNKEAAAISGCHPASIPGWSNGQSSHRVDSNAPSTHQNQEIKESIQDKVSERAVDRVLKSLDLIDDDKLTACNAVELANIAARLSTIGMKNLKDSGRMQVNIYTPSVKAESQFEIITVNNE